MNLLNWLGGQVEGAFSQINPFDNGADYNSVMARRRREQQAQQRPQPQQQPQPAIRRPLTYGGLNTPQPTQRQTPQLTAADMSRRSVAAKPANTLDEFNKLDVNAQRQRIDDLKREAGRTDFKSEADLNNTRIAQQRLKEFEERGQKKPGNPLTFAQDIVKGTVDTYGRVAQANARVLDDLTVGSQRKVDQARLDTMNQLANNRQQLMRQGAASPFLNPADDPRIKSKLADVDSKMRLQQATMQANRAKVMDETDPLKYGGAAAGVVLDALTTKAGSQAIMNGLRSPAQGFIKSVVAPQGIKQGIKSGATLGTGYGAAGTLEQMGGDANLIDYAKGMGTGALLGGAIGGAVPVVGRTASATSNRIKNFGLKPPTNLSPDELTAAAKIRQAQRGLIDPQTVTPQDAVLFQSAEAKLGAKPGTPAGNEAVAKALDAHRAFDREVTQRQMAAIDMLQRGNQFAKERLVPGGTLMGENASGFTKAKKSGLVFDGVDGKPRFEVDDSGAKLNDKEFGWGLKLDGKPRKIGDILEHDKLFEQYPELKEVNVRYEPNDLPGHDAHFDPDTNTIVITKSRADKSHLSDLVHELQHTIQEREGFAGGGAPEYRNYAAENASIKRGLQDVNTTLSGKNLTPEQTQRLRKRRANLIKQLEETQDQYGNVYTKAKDLAEYRRIAGEAEARAVQARMNMPMSERYVKDGVDLYHGTTDEAFKLDKKKPLFLTGDKDNAGTYGKPHKFGAKDGRTLDLNDNATREKYVREALGQDKSLEKYYKQIPDNVRNDYFDFLEWELAQVKAGKITMDDTKLLEKAFKDYKPITRKDVYANWDKVIAKAKKDGYDYIKHETEDPSADFTFPETVALNPEKTLVKGGIKPRSTFYDSLDVPKEDLIVRNDGGKAMSVEKQDSYSKANKELKQAIDSRIYESNPELFNTGASGRSFNETGSDSIPRLHVDDLRRYFGSTENIPAKYKRTTGKADIDELAARAGHDDIDSFVESIQRELDTRSGNRENQKLLRDLRNDPQIMKEAEEALAADKAKYGAPETFEPTARDLKSWDKMNRSNDESTIARVQRALDPNDKLQYKNLNPIEKKLYQGEKAKQKAEKLTKRVSLLGAGKQQLSPQKSQVSQVPQNQQAVATTSVATSSPKSAQKATGQGIAPIDRRVSTELRSYVDNTTDEVKKRGFVQSVKGSDEVSSTVRRKVNGKYNVRSTDKLALSADDFSKGNLQKVTDNVNERLDVKKGKITDQDVADSLAVAKRLDAQQRFDQSQAIYDKLAEHGTASGQTIQAFSLLKNRTPDGIKYQMIRELKKAGVNLTDADQKKVGQLIDNVRKTKPDTEARNRALFETMDYVAKKIPTSLGDKIVNFWRAGLLTAPKTTGGNIIGNASEVAARELWANPVAIATDKFFSLFTGKRTKTMSKGTAAGFKEGTTKGWDFMKTGYDPRNIQSKWDAPRRINYNNKVLDSYVNGVYRWMGTGDQPFYYGAKAAAAHDLAKADGLNLKLKGEELANYVEKSVTDPNWKPQTFKTAKDIEQYARYAVYQNETLLSNMARGIKNEAGKKNMRWITDFILPFTQVPSSIAMRIIDRTPIGTFKEMVTQIKNGSFDQRAMAEAIGNGSFGVPVVMAGIALAQAGELTGDYPTDSKERKLWEEEGKQPYSVRIGDKWHSLNYLQPFGTILNIGKKFDDLKKDGMGDAEAWMTAIGAAGQSITDQSFLKGLNGTLSALNDPDRSLGQFAKQTAGSTIPNFVRSFASAIDPKQREMNDAFDAVKGSVPGVRQTLPEKQGMFGNTLERRDNAANSYLNPLRPSNVKNENDPLLKELRRLQDADNGIVTTSFTNKSIGGVELSDQQVRDLNKQVNSQVEAKWNEAINDSRYAGLSDEDKNTVLKRIKDSVMKGVKGDFVQQNAIQTSAEYKASSKSPFSTSGKGVEISSNIAADYKKTLERYNNLDDGERRTWFNKENDAEYKYQLARYENDKAQGKLSAAQDIKKKNELRKSKVGANYSKNVRDLYSLSKADLADYLSENDGKTDKAKIAEDLLKYDRDLYDSGASSTRKFKNGFGVGRKAGGRRGGGRKGNGIASAKAFVSLTSSINKQLAANTPRTTGSRSPATGIQIPQMKKAPLRKYSVKKAEVSKKPIKIKTSKA